MTPHATLAALLLALLLPALGGCGSGSTSTEIIAAEEQAVQFRCDCWEETGAFSSRRDCVDRGEVRFTAGQSSCLDDVADERAAVQTWLDCVLVAAETERDCYQDLRTMCAVGALQDCRTARNDAVGLCETGVPEADAAERDRCLL